jgi:hypothetical protein
MLLQQENGMVTFKRIDRHQKIDDRWVNIEKEKHLVKLIFLEM